MTVAAGDGSGGGGGGGGGGPERVETRRRQYEDEEFSTEQMFEERELPTWKEQLSVRAICTSIVLGFFHNCIVMKLSLTTGIIPSLNVSAGLLGFFFVKMWTKVLEKAGVVQQPFTRQENTVVQTCIVACSSMAFSGGFGGNILAMSHHVAKNYDEGNTDVNIKDPSVGWMVAFLFMISFIGLFCVVPLRKIMILGYKLTYPTGSATAHLINSFHTPQGVVIAKKQVSVLFRSFLGSVGWSMFQWFYKAGRNCGFISFPTFGLTARKNRFSFDFSGTYIGVGMMCPPMVNLSMLFGSLVSWGILWPYIRTKEGDWYPINLGEKNLHGIFGYQVFIGIALVLGDGLFHFFTVMFQTLYDIRQKQQQQGLRTAASCRRPAMDPPSNMSFDERRRIKVFLKDQIPTRVVASGYLALAVASIASVPSIFPMLRSYHIAAAYIVAPVFAFCNAYGCGLTDWSLAANYGKLAIFIFGSWVGMQNGGLLAGLAACGLMLSIVTTAADIMQDFKTGYLTLTSPRAMFVSQAIGMAMGCIISPCVFMLFYKAFIINPTQAAEYKAPYSQIYRGMALLGAKGFSSLPKNCVGFCVVAFLAGIGLNMFREVARYMGWRVASYVPSAMGMAVPFYSGASFSIDMCVGGLVMYLWGRVDRRWSMVLGPAVASGIICGDGLWTMPESLLALWGVQPPMCMKFLSNGDNARVAQELGL